MDRGGGMPLETMGGLNQFRERTVGVLGGGQRPQFGCGTAVGQVVDEALRMVCLVSRLLAKPGCQAMQHLLVEPERRGSVGVAIRHFLLDLALEGFQNGGLEHG